MSKCMQHVTPTCDNNVDFLASGPEESGCLLNLCAPGVFSLLICLKRKKLVSNKPADFVGSCLPVLFDLLHHSHRHRTDLFPAPITKLNFMKISGELRKSSNLEPGLFYFPSVSLDIIQNIISEFVTAKHDAFILIQLTVTNPIIFSSVCSRGQRDAFRADVGNAGVQFYFILAAGTHRGTHRTQNAWLTLNYDINMSDLLVPLVKHDDLLHDGKQLIWTLGSWLHI